MLYIVMYMKDEYLTTQEIAKLLKVHNLTVRRWINSGELLAVFLGKGYRIRKKDLDKFLTKRKTRC